MEISHNWPSILTKLDLREDLSKAEATWAMEQMISGGADADLVAKFLLAMRTKGESAAELSGFIDVMLQNAISVPVSSNAVDIVGTGGDQLGTVNISSMAAIVAAASGVPVLKHGSRSASGKTGSSEFFEALGVKLELAPGRIAEIFDLLGLGFFFAPLFHPALKNVAAIRKELGVPTTFNFLGPMVNPVQPVATALGVAKADIVEKLTDQLVLRGRSAIVFRGDDGLDELTTTTNSYVNLVHQGQQVSQTFDPASLGLEKASIEDLIGGNARQNAETAVRLFSGELGEKHPIFEIVALNAAVAMSSYDLSQSDSISEFDFHESMTSRLTDATIALANGSAMTLLDRWVEESNRTPA